jgi:hypothetical protein
MTTYYVDGAVGDDANAGTSEGAGNAWATMDNAMNNVAAGDIVYVKASATYNEIATIDTLGTSTLPIQFIGYTTTPGDSGIVTCDGGSSTAYCFYSSWTSLNYYIFANFKCQNFAQYGWRMANADTIYCINCEASNNGSGGFYGDNSWKMFGCKAMNNTGRGMWLGTSTSMAGSELGGNTTEQLYFDNAQVFYKNLIHSPSSAANNICRLASVTILAQNTVDCDSLPTNSGVGAIDVATMTYGVVTDNLIHQADGDFNIRVANSTTKWTNFISHNMFSSSTSTYTVQTNGGAEFDGMMYASNVTTAASFTDEGTDYTLDGTCDAVDGGLHVGTGLDML